MRKGVPAHEGIRIVRYHIRQLGHKMAQIAEVPKILRTHNVPRLRTRRLRICAQNGCPTEPPTTQHKYCKQHQAEWKASRWTTVPCTQCDKPVAWRVSDLRRQTTNLERVARNPLRKSLQTMFFCDKECQGIYSGTHYGWGNANHPIHQEEAG
ncbi:hypothetical protein IH879_20825 [candidate division KSB1 bacterium]|nr:hypothetical protein [candidate division KSB1 bacterium]